MAYQMKGNKNPGSSYKNSGPGEELKNKGLMGPVSESDWWDEDSSKSTMLPEFEVGSDGSSNINFDSSTDKGIETLYTGDREGEGSTGKGNLARSKTSISSMMGNWLEGSSGASMFMDDLRSKPMRSERKHTNLTGRVKGTTQQRKAEAFDFDNTQLPEQPHKDWFNSPMHTLTKKSGKEKAISKQRYDKLAPKLEKRKAKGKNVKRSVSNASVIDRIISRHNKL